MVITPELLKRNIKVIDLSGAWRLKDVSVFEQYYKMKHLRPALLPTAAYGLPELNRDMIQGADLVANPGCYPTAVNLGLWPLIANGLIASSTKIMVEAISGYTGGGKKVKIPETVTPYKSGRVHQHVPEMEQALNLQEQLLFYPHIAPWPRGIEAVISVELLNRVNLLDLYKQFYSQELFIRIKSGLVKTGDVIETSFCDIYPAMPTNHSAVIKVVIDNLALPAYMAWRNFELMTKKEG